MLTMLEMWCLKNEYMGLETAALLEALGSIPSIPMATYNCNSSPKRSNALFWPLWSPGTLVYAGKTPKHIIMKNKVKLHQNKK